MGSFAPPRHGRELFARNAFSASARGLRDRTSRPARLCGDLRLSVATRRHSPRRLSEMRRYGYPQSFAPASFAAAARGHHDSAVDGVRGLWLITEQDVASCSSPASCQDCWRLDVHDHITLIGMAKPGFLPEAAPRSGGTCAERLAALRDVWATLLLFAFVIADCMGLFTRRKPPVRARAARS